MDNFVLKIFDLLSDEIFICDEKGNILYLNNTAQEKYPKISNLNKLSHIFNFDICILKSEDIIKYNPIYVAINSKEAFYASITKQINSELFLSYSISSASLNENSKIIILKNEENKIISERYATLEKKNKMLEKQITSDGELKIKLENQLLRTNLINLVSDKVREYISTKKIIKIILEQLKKTISITDVEFSTDTNTKKTITTIIEKNNKSILKMTNPVYMENKIYGQLILYRKNTINPWQKEEISLIQNICSLLATAFAKEELYEELQNQKNELENTLTQLKNAQLQIVQSEKMASLGKLVAGVAHEINTPLGAVSSNLNLLERYTNKTNSLEELKTFLQKISPINKEGLRRIDSMVKALKNFTRLDEAKKNKVNIIDGIESTLALLAHEIKNKIEIQKNYNKIPEIYCYPDYINQVFMNIILNACQSMKNKGIITITTEKQDKYIKVIISDTGSGIKKENLSKIFDFGYTTKEFGQGTGLGLSLAKKIIEEHNGKIEAESIVGKGTTFNIFLPI